MIAALLVSATLTDPYQIFGMARVRWEAQHYPEKVAYTVAVDIVESGVRKTERYEAGYDAAEESLLVDPVSDREKAHPYYAPGGFGFNTALSGPGRPNPDVDFFGVPFLAPNYSFGIGVTPRGSASPPPNPMELVREIRAAFHDPLPPSRAVPVPAASAGLREIAVVTTRTRTYAINLVGIEPIDGTPAYHLVLRPLRDPGRYRLRDLWIDTQSYAPRELVEGRNFVEGPGTAVAWCVKFEQTGGASYIATETALAPTNLGRHHYSAVSIAFENVRAVARFSYGVSSFVPDGTLILGEP
ncbi:MAG: hypothetical protein WBE83_06665 [Candidatus Cybelea sp.]|jgi:hypothetical protein